MRFAAFALLCLLSLHSQAENLVVKNACRLTFTDGHGIAMAEAEFVTPEFTAKEHGPLKVKAEIQLLDNTSATKGAGWLKRLLKTGKRVEIEIRTSSYKTKGGDIFSTTNIEFNPDAADANISVTYMHPPQPKGKSWAYGTFSGGFKGGRVIFDRIQLPAHKAPRS